MFQHRFSSAFIIAVFSFILSVNVHAASGTSPIDVFSPDKDSTTLVNEEAISALKKLQPSMSGTTEQGNRYNLYAVKKRKQWTFIILDNVTYYSYRKDKQKDTIQENSETTTNMLCMMAQTGMLRKRNKPRDVSGITLSCYYKFRPQAKKIYKSVSKLEKNAKFIYQNSKEGKKGLIKILTM